MMNFDKVAALGESESIVKDLSIYSGFNTVYGPPTRVSNGKRGGAYLFDAATEYIRIQDSSRFTLTGNYTISAWINPNDVANRTKGIMGTRNGSNGFYFGFTANDSNTLRLYSNTDAYSNYEIKEDGLRKHVAYVRSGSVGTFYVNGSGVATVVGT